MAFYRPNIKWYHRLWNIFGYTSGVLAILFYSLVLSLPHYVISGDKKVAGTVEFLFDCLVFTDN